VDEFVDMMGERVDFRRDLQKGDAFAMILKQEQYSDGSWGKPIELIGAGLINNGKLKAVTKVLNKSGKFQSFDELGQPIGNHFLQYPVKFTRVSSIFTDSRLHPVLKIKRPHNGVDFAAPTGTPVRSVGDGVVEKAGYFGAAGNMIKISHSKRWSTAYLHLSKIDKSIRVGSRVSKGQLIGAVGSTGLSSGPHLHFSLYDNNKYVDPIKTKLPGIYNEKDLPSNNIIQASLAPLKKQLESVMIANAANKVSRG
jgi:murein DD-endopeptidase MepM/ murein hydrolase activator NlpD